MTRTDLPVPTARGLLLVLVGAVLALGACPGEVESNPGDDDTADFWEIDESAQPSGDDDTGDDDDAGDDDDDTGPAEIDTAYFYGELEPVGQVYQGLAAVETFALDEQYCGYYALIEAVDAEPCNECVLAVEFTLHDLETYVGLDCSDYPPAHFEGLTLRIGFGTLHAYLWDPDAEEWAAMGQVWQKGDQFGWYAPLI